MGLVDYSDSETSDIEETSASTPLSIPDPGAPKPSTTFSAQFDSPRGSLPGTPKESTSAPRRIKVDLSSLRQTAVETDEEVAADEPPAKRARTAGAFSGFNSLLPAPKRTAAQNAPKAGVSLKTSSEAAFSRSAVPVLEEEDVGYDESGGVIGGARLNEGDAGDKTEPEVKIVGKATRFKPLSVSSKKKKSVIPKAAAVEVRKGASMEDADAKLADKKERQVVVEETEGIPAQKPKRSLFSVPQQEEAEDLNIVTAATGTYESITTTQLDNDNDTEDHDRTYTTQQVATAPTQPNPNSLKSLTSDLNLTAAQKRQLFGRNGNTDISIAHFNMDSEYAANEQLRQAGEVVEHKAVKAIAPGKHSLQQLVNNARSQQENLEDKWAAGRAARGTMR